MLKPIAIAATGFVALTTAAVAGIQAPPAPPPSPSALDQPAYERPAAEWEDLEDAQAENRECRDTIRRVRAESGQPELEPEIDRRPASPDRAYMIAAVDKRLDGCAVMQMHGDVSDLRPLPPAPEGGPMLHRAD